MTLAVKAVGDGEWIVCEPLARISIGGREILGRMLARMSPEDLAESGLEAAEPVGEPPVPSLGDPPVLSYLEGVPTWVWSPGGLANLRLMRVNEIKAEAGRRIMALYPAWKQANMNMRATELVDIRLDRELTPEEDAERAQMLSAAAWIKSIRAASDAIEADLLDDAEGLSAFDAATADGWPA